jgi:hypothetical protein
VFNIAMLRSTVHGIRGSFLTKNEETVAVDGELGTEIQFLSTSIFYFSELIHDKSRDVKEVCIVANDQFFMFFRSSYALGVIASPAVNVPLLKTVAHELLEDMVLEDV